MPNIKPFTPEMETSKLTISGTCFHEFCLFPITPNELIKTLGEPTWRNEDRVQWEWIMVLTEDNGNQIPFCIYDYKEYRQIKPTTMYGEWHIGTHTDRDATTVKDNLEQMITDLKLRSINK